MVSMLVMGDTLTQVARRPVRLGAVSFVNTLPLIDGLENLADLELHYAVPSKLLEAMGRGVPVLLAAAGESAEILEASGGGLSCAPGDRDGLLAAALRLAGMSAAERRAMGGRGRAHVRKHFRRETAAAVLSSACRELAHRP